MKCGWDCKPPFVRSGMLSRWINLRAELPFRMLKALTAANMVLLFHYPKEVGCIVYHVPFIQSNFDHTQDFIHSHWPHNPGSADSGLLNDTYMYLTQPAWLIFRRKRSGPPTADSLAQMLIQALHSQDNTLLEVRYYAIFDSQNIIAYCIKNFEIYI